MSDLAADGVQPPGKDATDEEIRAYKVQLEERATHYQNTLAFIHILGAVVLPGSAVTGTSGQGTGVTKTGAAYYKWRYESGPLADGSIVYGSDEYYNTLNAYMRAHPGAWPYSVSTHPGADDPGYVPYGSPSYGKTTLDPAVYTQNALDRVAYWADDEPTAGDAATATEETAPADFASLSPRRQQKALVTYAITPGDELTTEQLDALGVSDFDGRDALYSKFGRIEKQTDEAIDKFPNLTDEQKQKLYDLRDLQMANAASNYGPDGAEALKLYRATPAQKLRAAGYWHGPAGSMLITGAEGISRHAIANGASPMYASESAGVLQAKVDLYRRLELLRLTDPKFDADIRRAEIALHEKDRTAGRVAVYEYLFFGQPANYFGYQDALVRSLNAAG
jgi:hypothetical protein